MAASLASSLERYVFTNDHWMLAGQAIAVHGYALSRIAACKPEG